jgi:hypothetical protein
MNEEELARALQASSDFAHEVTSALRRASDPDAYIAALRAAQAQFLLGKYEFRPRAELTASRDPTSVGNRVIFTIEFGFETNPERIVEVFRTDMLKAMRARGMGTGI